MSKEILAPPPSGSALPVVGSSAPGAIEIGQFYDMSAGRALGPLRFGGETSMMVFGPNGSGKATRLLVPNLLRIVGKSLVVIDPKGELAAITAPFRRKLGRVVVINPFNEIRKDFAGYDDLASCGFNPLAALNPAAPSFNMEAGLLADALVVSDGKEAHWTESARALVAVLIMHATCEAREAGRVPTMRRVRELLCMPSCDDDPTARIRAKGIPKLMRELCESSIEGIRNKASQFTEWNKEVQGIASTAKRQTEAFDDTELADDLEKDGFRFEDIKREAVTVYLILPPGLISRHSRWLRLLLSSAINASLRPRREHEPGILFMLDEFFALGHFKLFEDVWNIVRGYGVQFMPILQSLPQLQKLYGDKGAELLLNAAGVVTCFTPNDFTTAAWLSRRAGQKSVMVASSNSGQNLAKGGVSTSAGRGVSEIGVPLLRDQELFGMQRGALLSAFAGGSNIAASFAPNYYEMNQYKNLFRDNPYYPAKRKD